MSQYDCNCHPQRPNPCPDQRSLVCDPAYYQMLTVARVKLLGVPVGSSCQAFIAPKRGFVFSDESGAGQFISEQPQISLPIINSVASNVYAAPPGFPFLVVGTGSAPHLWNFVRGQTGVASQVLWDGTQFVLQNAGDGAGPTAPCSAPSAAAVTIFGCAVVDGDTVLRKLNVLDAHPIVGVVDEDGNQTVKALPNSENLTHPLGKFTTLRANVFQALNDDGTDTAGGFPQLVSYSTGAVTDAVLCYYSPTTKKIYKAPAGYVLTRTNFETASLSDGVAGDEFTFSSVVLNYSTLQVSATFNVGAVKKLTLEVLVDGVVQQTWTNSDGTTAVSASITGQAYIKNITPGVRTVVFRLTSTGAGATVRSGVASIATSNIPL